MESNRYFRSVLKGIVGTLLFSFIGIAILSMLMTKLVFSKSIFNMVYVIISLLSLSMGAIIAAKKNGSKGWLVGIGVGLGYYISMMIISKIVGSSISFQLIDFAKLLISLMVGVLAGILGINM